MRITRLSWAGLILESSNTTLYIDPLQNADDLVSFLGKPASPLFPVPLPVTGAANVLVTHIQPDHYDQALLKVLLAGGGQVWGPTPVYRAAIQNGLKANTVYLQKTFTVGDFQVTPVPAVDWVGEEQVSYVITDGDHTIIHGGDTNWHGHWWPIVRQFGEFAAAFLPVNGVVGSLPGKGAVSRVPGTMNPFQAITAARILDAVILVPMHYGVFNNPPAYTEFPDLDTVLDQEALVQNVIVQRMTDGETLSL